MERRVYVERFKSGFTLYSLPDDNFRISGIGFRGGSLHDPPGKEGLAHGVEHGLTQQSKKYPKTRDINLLYHKYIGGIQNLNMFTTWTTTFYGHADVRRKGHLRHMFDILSSFLNPATRMYDLDVINGERAAMHQEYHYTRDMLEPYMSGVLYRLLYSGHPVGRPIDGNLETIKAFGRDDVRRFLRRWYTLPNMYAVFLGPSREEARHLAEVHVDNWDVTTRPFSPISPAPHSLHEMRSHEETRARLNQHHLMIGFPTESTGSADTEAIDILSRVLGHRLLERLRNENREFNGGVYRVPVEFEQSLVHGILSIHIATTGKEFLKIAEEVVREEAGLLREKLISGAESDAMSTRMLNEFFDAFYHEPNVLVDLIADAASNGDEDLDGFHSTRKRITKVTRKKVRDVANKYLTKDYARVVVYPAS